MSKNRIRYDKGIELHPENVEGISGEDLTREGELAVDSSDGKLKARLSSETRSVVTEDQIQTLENKTIDGTDATGNNTVKADASDITYDNATSGSTAITSQEALDVLDNRADIDEQNLADHLADPTDAHDASAISYDNTTSGSTQDTVQAIIDENEGRVDAVEIDLANFKAEKGAANGLAPLNASSQIDAAFLPSYVDDVLEFADFASLPNPGETEKIYVTLDDNKTFRYSGTIYIEVSPSDVNSVNGQTGIVVLDKTDVGLTNVTDDAQLKRDAADFDTFVEKESPVNDDIVLIEDSEDSFSKKKVLLSNLLGGGSGGINHIDNSDAEQGTEGYVVYADAAQEVAEDGTAGTGNITFTQNTIDPLRDDADFLLSKDAADRQGEGVSYDFTIDNADKGQPQVWSFQYKTTSDYQDGDIRFYVYDVTNSNIIRVSSGENLGASTLGQRHFIKFQTAIDSVNYRIIKHVASTNALAYDVQLDNISVGPVQTTNGAIVTAWENFQLESNWDASFSTTQSSIRRIGGSVECFMQVVLSGAPPTGNLEIELPENLAINLNKIATTGNLVYIGSGSVLNNGVRLNNVDVTYRSDINKIRLTAHSDATAHTSLANVTNLVPFGFNVGDGFAIEFTYPVEGWQASGTLSTDYGNREILVDAKGSGTGVNVTANVTDIPFLTVTDNTSSWSGTEFLVPSTGKYDFSGSIHISAGQSDFGVELYVNGTLRKRLGYNNSSGRILPFSGSEALEQGQIATIRINKTATLTNGLSTHNLFISNSSGSQSIIDDRSVVAFRYETDSGQIITNNVDTTLIFDQRVFDTHNIYDSNTGIITIPSSGFYSMSLTMLMSGANTDEVYRSISLVVNLIDSTSRVIAVDNTAGVGGYSLFSNLGTLVQYYEKGTQLRIDQRQNTGSNQVVNNNIENNYLTLHKIK